MVQRNISLKLNDRAQQPAQSRTFSSFPNQRLNTQRETVTPTETSRSLVICALPNLPSGHIHWLYFNLMYYCPGSLQPLDEPETSLKCFVHDEVDIPNQ